MAKVAWRSPTTTSSIADSSICSAAWSCGSCGHESHGSCSSSHMKAAYMPARELFVYRRREAVLYVIAAYTLWLVPALLAAALMDSVDASGLRWPAVLVLEVL